MIRHAIIAACAAISLLSGCSRPSTSVADMLFNGSTFQGWEGDTVNTWKIMDSAIVGGSLAYTIAHNNFLCTVDSFDNFRLHVQFKLLGDTGFVNSGVQFRSRRAQDPAYEMSGYQADLGKGYWGSLYDESRRNKTLSILDSAHAAQLVKKDQWNDFEVVCESSHIQIFLNGEKTVDYTEPDKSIPGNGLIGLQVHGGGKTQVWFKNIRMQKL